MGKPEIKDVRQELKKYGQYNPGKKFLEELKQRQKVLSERKVNALILIQINFIKRVWRAFLEA